jgi:hypothetical protein
LSWRKVVVPVLDSSGWLTALSAFLELFRSPALVAEFDVFLACLDLLLGVLLDLLLGVLLDLLLGVLLGWLLALPGLSGRMGRVGDRSAEAESSAKGVEGSRLVISITSFKYVESLPLGAGRQKSLER